MNLSEKEKEILIQTARASIGEEFGSNNFPEVDLVDFPLLKEQCGAFVTLTINGRLRGCVGYIVSNDSLVDTVKEAAKLAAFHDNRFNPLTAGEFSKIKIEISALSPTFKMQSYDDIVLGVHGLIVTEKGRKGLLLPQVPIEHGMDKEEYLSALCQKAGLSSNLWKEKILNIDMFTATVFNEGKE